MKQVVKSPYTMMHCDGLLGRLGLGGKAGSGMLAVCGAWMSRWKLGSVGEISPRNTPFISR